MSIENKLTYLDGTKDAIKQAIIDKGVSVTESDTFRSYATKIGEIQGGGGTATKYTGHADTVGLKAIGWTDEDIQYYQENGVNWNEEDDEYHKVPEDNIALYGVLNENNIQDYKDLIVYLPKIEITKTSLRSMFTSCNIMVAIPLLNTSSVTNMSNMFSGCWSLVCIPMLDTSSVTNMSSMFSGCYSLVSVPQLNTSNNSIFMHFFDGCYSLTTIPLLDTSKGSDFSFMFSNCYSLPSVPMIDTSYSTNFTRMFENCYKITNTPDLIVNNIYGISQAEYIFSRCESLVSTNVFGLKYNSNLKLIYSALLSKESLLYMIQNAAPTSAITITLHSNVYDKYIEDPDIVSALEAQPLITLAK